MKRSVAVVAAVGCLWGVPGQVAVGQDVEVTIPAETMELPPGFPGSSTESDPTTTPGFTTVPRGVMELFESSLDALVADADKDDAAAALAAARAYFINPDLETQKRGLPYLVKAAELGAEEALILLGDARMRGAYGLSPDTGAAIAEFETAIESGSVAAKLALGRLLLATDFSSEGQQRGIDLLIEAANEGRLEAATQLGSLYAQGRGVELDPQRAMRYFGMGLLTNDRASFVAAGDLLRYGAPDFPPNPALGLQLFERAIELGDIGAKRRVADMHLRGEAVTQDLETAVRLLTELGEGGDSSSFITLGDIYARGEFVVADGRKAIDYYQRAADQGNALGTVRIGDAYIAGLPGLLADVGKGMEYYEEASGLGNTNAMRALANLYLGGAGPQVRPDPVRATELLTEAASRGDGGAAEALAILYANNDPFSADYGTVKTNLDIALATGNTRAALRVASAIAQGPLARAHSDEAYALLTNALNSGVPGAAAELARLQLAGAFPAQGLAGVISMLDDAARSGDIDSARYLLALYRDGSGLLLPPDRAAAESFLASIEPILGSESAAFERINLLAPRSENLETLQAISAEFSKLGKDTGLRALDNLRRINARAYVYVLQERLAERGFYDGPLSGTLDGQTIRAFREVCTVAGADRECAPGPMTAGAALVLGTKIFEPLS